MSAIRRFAGSIWSLDRRISGRPWRYVAGLILALAPAISLTIGAPARAQGPQPRPGGDKYPVEIVPSVGGAAIHPLAVTRDGRFAAIPAGNGAELWDLEKGRLVRTFAGLKGLASSVDISLDGTRVAAGGSAPLILIWDVATGRAVGSLRPDMSGINGIAFSADGSSLAFAGDPRTNFGEAAKPSAFVGEIASGRIVQSSFSPAPRGFGNATRLAASPDRRTVAVGDNDGTIRLWGFDDRRARVLAAHRGCGANLCSITTLSFSPDGRYLASGSYDATAKIWEVASGRLLRTLPAGGGPRLVPQPSPGP